MRHVLFFLTSFLLVACGLDSDTENPVEPLPFTLSVDDDSLFVLADDDFFTEGSQIVFSNSMNLNINEFGVLSTAEGLIPLVAPTNPDGSAAALSVSTSMFFDVGIPILQTRTTENARFLFDLPADARVIENAESSDSFANGCPDSPLAFSASTIITVFDSLDVTHELGIFLSKASDVTRHWVLRFTLDCDPVDFNLPLILDFNENGELDIDDADLDGFVTAGNGRFTIRHMLNNGADDLSISVSFVADDGSESTSANAEAFNVRLADQDGGLIGDIENINIDANGIITIQFTNGSTNMFGKLMLARFRLPENLQEISSGMFIETDESQAPIFGEAGELTFGQITPLAISL